MGRHLLFDVESDGLLKTLTRIHCLVVRDIQTRETFRFRRHDGYVDADGVVHPPEDTIADGLKMLEEADVIAGHNIIRFDLLAIQKVYPTFCPRGKIIDTLILTRMIYSNIKDTDFRLVKEKRIPGNLIGSHSLDAWGYRVGLNKGSYAKDCALAGIDPWAKWSMEMEDYCVLDVDVNEVIWAGCQRDMPPDTALDLETAAHDLTGVMERNGYPFDLEGAKALLKHLEEARDALVASVRERYGFWFAPAKKKIVKRRWVDPENPNIGVSEGEPIKYDTPNTAWGEDYSRAVWGEITFPKREWKHPIHGRVYPDAPFCMMKRVEFNPGSRPHIIDRFVTVHNWVPEDFTDKGTPEVNDAVLTKLGEKIPEAKLFAQIFQYNKLIGYISSGNQAWIKNAEEDGMIHCYINTGGTVSGRCSHTGPNIGQIPAVVVEENPATKEKIILRGLEGDYGYECRSLFYTPAPMMQVGVDLSGIEFRCLAELCAPFDNGALIDVVLNKRIVLPDGTVLKGDIHVINMRSLEGIVNQRETVKRILYGLLYGAGDWKLGFTANPYASPEEQKALGAHIRAKLMQGLPALKMAIDTVRAEAAAGWIRGLDGRKLHARSQHSALNLRLQSDAAMIAKKWLTLTEQYLMEAGLNHGWPAGFDHSGQHFNNYAEGGDFSLLAFVHDEIQMAVRPEYVDLASELCIKAAADAGTFFGFKCPIGAEAKVGHNWQETH